MFFWDSEWGGHPGWRRGGGGEGILCWVAGARTLRVQGEREGRRASLKLDKAASAFLGMDRQPLLRPLLGAPLGVSFDVEIVSGPREPGDAPVFSVRAAPPPPPANSKSFFSLSREERVPQIRDFIVSAAGSNRHSAKEGEALVAALDSARMLLESEDAAQHSALEAEALLLPFPRLPGATAREEAVDHLIKAADRVRRAAASQGILRTMTSALEEIRAKLGPERDESFPHGSFSVGMQLLPATALRYCLPFGDLFVALDALFCGALGRKWWKIVRHERLCLVLKPAQGSPHDKDTYVPAHTLVCPVLKPQRSFDRVFDARAYLRVLAARWVAWVLLALGLVVSAILGITFLTVVLPGGYEANPFSPIYFFFFALIDAVKLALTGPNLSALALALGGVVSFVAIAVTFVMVRVVGGGLLFVYSFYFVFAGGPRATPNILQTTPVTLLSIFFFFLDKQGGCGAGGLCRLRAL
jgi:hypothetical protein